MQAQNKSADTIAQAGSMLASQKNVGRGQQGSPGKARETIAQPEDGRATDITTPRRAEKRTRKAKDEKVIATYMSCSRDEEGCI